LFSEKPVNEARVEAILGIDSPALKSRHQLRLDSVDPDYANEARQEALRHMAAGKAAFETQQKEEMISSSRFKQIHIGLYALAQKVYSAVPISEPWSTSYIQCEMQRNGGSNKDMSIISGCLNSLVASGLIVEKERGTFMRAPVKDKPIDKQSEQPTSKKEPMATLSPKTHRSPVAILSAISTRANVTADALKKLAEDIEMAALEIEESISLGDAETQKLRQLQQLLKSL
jgi:hypothetical protein